MTHLKLKPKFPTAKSYSLVTIGVKWRGLRDHIDLRQNYFCLLKNTWPVDFVNPEQIMTPIEDLFKLIKQS